MKPAWLSGVPGRWRIELHVQPGAKRTAVIGEHDGRLKLAVAAPPIEGRANEVVIAWFADRLRVPRSALRISAGARGRRKAVLLEAPLAEDLLARLGEDD